MYIQLNSVIIDGDTTNRQELATFLAQFGVTPTAQLPNVEGLPAVLGRADAPQLIIVNLDPNAHDNLKRLAGLPRQDQRGPGLAVGRVRALDERLGAQGRRAEPQR